MKKITVDERWLRIGAWVLICVGIVAGAAKYSKHMVDNPRKAPLQETEEVLPDVKVEVVERSTIEVDITSHGEVSPMRRTTLSAEVGGRLISVAPDLEAGEVFKEGDVLLQLDSADYDAALSAAKASLADAELALKLELSRGKQAERDWKRLKGEAEASDMVKRLPHLASAQAAVVAAQSAVEKAQRDVDRTLIKVPYDCRVERTYVDLGTVVNPGMQLVDLVSRGPVEVRLALSLEDYGYLQRDEDGRVMGEVTASREIGGKMQVWTGALVRSEEIVERSTRSINVVAEFGRENGETPPIGMFVKAVIKGISVSGVVKVPRAAMLDGERVLLVTAEKTLEFREVEVMRTERDHIIVSGGLQAGERVVTVPPGTPTAGARVNVKKEAEPGEQEARKGQPEKPAEAKASS